MSTWQATTLSVVPPSRQVADTDRIALTFTAGEAITAATGTVVLLPGNTPISGIIEGTIDADTDTNTATVILSGFTTGKTYRLDVVFTRSDLTRYTKTLVLDCIA